MHLSTAQEVSVTAGMAIYDTMQYIKPDVSTICVGLAPVWAFLLSSGTKGKNGSSQCQAMIHPLGGGKRSSRGYKIHADWIPQDREKLNRIMAENSAFRRFRWILTGETTLGADEAAATDS